MCPLFKPEALFQEDSCFPPDPRHAWPAPTRQHCPRLRFSWFGSTQQSLFKNSAQHVEQRGRAARVRKGLAWGWRCAIKD